MVHRGASALLLASGFMAGVILPTGAFALTPDEPQQEVQVAAAEQTSATQKTRKVKPAAHSAATKPRTVEPPPTPAPPMPSGWLVTVRGNVIVSPDFPGAKNYGFMVYPSFSIRSPATPETFKAPDDGVSLAVAGETNWSVGVVGRYQSGRYRSDNKALTGIHDAKWALEPGLFGEFWALRDTLRLRAELRFGVNGYNGPVANLGADLVQTYGRFTLSGGPRMAIAGTDYMRTYFGVTEADALANASVTPYRPDAGVKSVGVAAAATYRWNENWATTIHGGYDRLVGQAADSPIVKAFGSRDQFFVGANASYSFPLSYTNP